MKATIQDAALISMMAPKTLEKLAEYASRSQGGILEIGPYVGGSTLALAIGNQARFPHLAIETGGAHPTHPRVPSSDIIADWRANIARFGLTGETNLLPGWTFAPGMAGCVRDAMSAIGLLFIDADGSVARDVRLFAASLAPDAMIVLDDYESAGASDKARAVRSWVNHHVVAGRLKEDEVLGGTWFGRLSGLAARDHFATAPAFGLEQNFAWIAFLKGTGPSDTMEGQASMLRLFEEGEELGPAHSMHEEIRNLGAGRFSHWLPPLGAGEALIFSSSDNSDPNVNGCTYCLDIGRGPMPIEHFL